LGVFVAVSCGNAPGADGGQSGYHLIPDPHGKVLKAPDGRVVFSYMTKKPVVTNLAASSVCCFHPLNTPSGGRVTDLAPGDHHHHRGVFLAWHTLEFWEKADFSRFGPYRPTHGWNIDRGDFWGWGEFAPTEGRVIQNRHVKLVEADREHAKLEILNAWVVRNKVRMDELLSAEVREQGGVYVVDLTYRFTPAVDLKLNHSSFGGFCVRARNDGNSYFATVDGKVELPDAHYSVPDLNWPAADWYDFTIELKSGKTVGVAVVDHPKNPPSTWHNPRYIWMINPCIVAGGPVEVEKDHPLVLRYRLVVHDGPTPVDLLETLSADWRKQ
jgi:hypothetical protein